MYLEEAGFLIYVTLGGRCEVFLVLCMDTSIGVVLWSC